MNTPNAPDETQAVERLRPDSVAPVDQPEEQLLDDFDDLAAVDDDESETDDASPVLGDDDSGGTHTSPYPDAGYAPHPDEGTTPAPNGAESHATATDSLHPDGWGPGVTPNVQYQTGVAGAPVDQYYDPYPQGVVQFDPATEFSPPDDLPPWFEDEYYDDRDWEHLPRRTSTLFRVLLFVAGFGVIVLVSGFYGKNWVDDQLDPPGEPGEFVLVEVPQGASTNDIVRILEEESVVANGTVFRYYLRYKDAPEFQAGEYTFQRNMAVWDVKTRLDAGARVLETFRVTIPEGLRVSEIQDRLLSEVSQFDPVELSDAFTTVRQPTVFANQVLFSAEGYLFPDTYELDEFSLDNEAALLERMVTRFDDVANQIDIVNGAARLGVSPYQVLIIASLIEEEARAPEDRAKIARVIYNRLAAGEPLGIDATVVYALGGDRELSASDLDVDSPYNTRRFAGLPPTPIAAPGRASLEAALNPEDGDWFYYVLTEENGPGTHTFAVTGADFQAAVQICIDKGLGCG
jgi:uncharacterized YceG family protein